TLERQHADAEARASKLAAERGALAKSLEAEQKKSAAAHADAEKRASKIDTQRAEAERTRAEAERARDEADARARSAQNERDALEAAFDRERAALTLARDDAQSRARTAEDERDAIARSVEAGQPLTASLEAERERMKAALADLEKQVAERSVERDAAEQGRQEADARAEELDALLQTA